MNILIIDDHRLFAEGVQNMLGELGVDDLQTQVFFNAQSALDVINKKTDIDLILLDLHMSGLSGQELIQALEKRNIQISTIILSASTEYKDMLYAYEAGSKAYILKHVSSGEMLDVIRKVINGEEVFPDEFWRHYEQGVLVNNSSVSETTSELSVRAKEVLQLIAEGKTNKQIALILDISESTVKFHLKALFKLFGVNNRTWCVREAVSRCIIKE